MNDLPASPRADATPLAQPEDVRFRLLVESIADYAIMMLDTRGLIESWNRGVEAVFGYDAAGILGKPHRLLYPPDTAARGLPEHELEVATREGRYEDEGWRVRRDGSRFWANVVVSPLLDPAGVMIGFSKVVRDLSERRRQEERLRESEERFRLLVEGVEDYAIFMLTPQGRIASWNAGAQRLKGYAATEIIGQHFSRFYEPEAVVRHWPEHELEVARATGRFEDEGWRLRKDGTRFWANVLITALYDAAGRLRGFAKVTRDLTTRREVESLQQTERRMNEFLAMLAHELRNPLSPMRTALDILDRQPSDPRILAFTREVFARQLSHMTRLVDDLLDVGRITRGKIDLRLETVDLRTIVHDTAESLRPVLQAQNRSLAVRLGDEPVVIRADLTRMAQIVSNLLNNAAKYTPEGGHVEVFITTQDHLATLHVRDDGIGMAPELIPRVFDLFVQGDRGLDRQQGGLGLGLTLVKRLVELHGGSVAAQSAGAGKGSEFTVQLPTLSQQKPRDRPSSDRESVMPGLKVMVVEDNPDVADSIAMLLDMLGHTAEIAVDGNAALSRAPSLLPDVVLLDIGLPGMSGYDVARAMRALPALRHTILVACTGYGREDDRARALESGFDYHAVKPVGIDTLEGILAEAARRRETSAT